VNRREQGVPRQTADSKDPADGAGIANGRGGVRGRPRTGEQARPFPKAYLSLERAIRLYGDSMGGGGGVWIVGLAILSVVVPLFPVVPDRKNPSMTASGDRPLGGHPRPDRPDPSPKMGCGGVPERSGTAGTGFLFPRGGREQGSVPGRDRNF